MVMNTEANNIYLFGGQQIFSATSMEHEQHYTTPSPSHQQIESLCAFWTIPER